MCLGKLFGSQSPEKFSSSNRRKFEESTDRKMHYKSCSLTKLPKTYDCTLSGRLFPLFWICSWNSGISFKICSEINRAWSRLPELEKSTSFSYFCKPKPEKNPISKESQNPKKIPSLKKAKTRTRKNLIIENRSNPFLNIVKFCQ